MSSTEIEWLKNETHVVFIQKLTAQRRKVQLSINATFVFKLLSLREARLHETLTAMKQSSVDMLDIGSLPLPLLNRRSFKRKFSIFCQALGCMRQTTALYYGKTDVKWNERHVLILRSMPHVKFIALFGRKIDEATCLELVAALSYHSSLELIFLNVPVKYYPMILPALRTIQSLTKVALKITDRPLEVTDSPEAARAVVGLFNMGHTHPLLTLDLIGIDFTTPESQQTFCDALTETKIYGLGLVGGTFAEPVSLANAIVASNLKGIQLALLYFEENSVINFLTPLAEHIHTMTQLEKVNIGIFRMLYGLRHDRNDPDLVAYNLANDQANVQLVRAVAHCRQLKRLEISFNTLLPELDQVLADCVDPLNRKLEEIIVSCQPLGSTDDAQIVSAPLFAQALKKNYTIRKILFSTYPLDDGEIQPTSDPWSPDFIKSAQIIPLLNSAGREYVIKDAMDKMAGIRVLAAMSNELDCLFYHLRYENPSLCDRRSGNSDNDDRRMESHEYNKMMERVPELQKSVGGGPGKK